MSETQPSLTHLSASDTREAYSVILTSFGSIESLRTVAMHLAVMPSFPASANDLPMIFLERCSKALAAECFTMLQQCGCGVEMLPEPSSSRRFLPLITPRDQDAPRSVLIPARDLTIVLLSPGTNKINCIKAIREETSLGLKESKDLTDTCPSIIKECVSANEADRLHRKFTENGATVYSLSVNAGGSDVVRVYFDRAQPSDDILDTLKRLGVLDESPSRSKQFRSVPLERYLAMDLKSKLVTRGYHVTIRLARPGGSIRKRA